MLKPEGYSFEKTMEQFLYNTGFIAGVGFTLGFVAFTLVVVGLALKFWKD
jgi:hypothetical protein